MDTAAPPYTYTVSREGRFHYTVELTVNKPFGEHVFIADMGRFLTEWGARRSAERRGRQTYDQFEMHGEG